MFSLEKKRWQWLAILFLSMVWGSSFILMKRGLGAFDYMQVGAMRIFFSFVIMLPIAIKNLRLINKKNIGYLITLGLIGNFIPAVLFTLAQSEITSSLAGILNAIAPFFVLAIGVIFFGNRPSVWQYIGISVGFFGAFWLMSDGNLGSLGSINRYVWLIVIATAMYGVSSNLIKYRLQNLNGIQITSLSFFFVGPLAGIMLGFTDLKTPMLSPDFYSSLIATLILALFGSVLSLFVYYNLIHRAGPVFASSATYVVPFFALLWGIWDGEAIYSIHIYCLLIILTGVYLSSLRRKGQK
ncbi:MAG: EamA family transporter [Bacteroidales bacterium]|jgi:drug/metabolite transporter (DMT)-like permease|nr:EamA family transporter [Bacteroidales bacterium]